MGAARRVVVEMPSAEEPEALPFAVEVAELPRRARKGMRAATAEARRRVAEALPEVISTLATRAKDGDAASLKLFLEVSGVLKGGLAPAARERREKTLEEILFEQWERDKLTAADG